jgi:hypothetical protein
MKKLYLFLIPVFLFSCKKDEPVEPVPTPAQTIQPGDGVFVTNEGNFQFGNAKVSFFRFSNSTATEDVFQPANNHPLGDVCQGMSFINNSAYVVVNNSGKIEVVRPSDFVSLTTITGFTSPRYILQVSPTKAYVSDLYGNGLTIVNLSSNTIAGHITVPGWTERMLLVNGEVFVSNMNRDKLYVVNATSDQLTDSIPVIKGGNSLVTDGNGKLWLLCGGDYLTTSPGELFRINTATHAIEWNAPFAANHYPSSLVINPAGNTLYFIDTDIRKMNITDVSLPAAAFITAAGRNYYTISVHPTGDLWISDAVDYVQRGRVYKFNATGAELSNFTAGVIPGGIYFY